MKKLLITLAVFFITAVMLIPTVIAAELITTSDYPTKITYDEATKTMTITYVGSGGWYELMPISDSKDPSIQNFIDKYRTEVEHIEIGKFGKIQLVEVKDKDGNVTDTAKLFYGMTALKSVHFAEGQRILVIGSECGLFEGCKALTTVWFGDDANKIEGCANFTGCNIKDNDNAKGQNNFAKNLFKDCSSLKSVIYTANTNESVIYSSTFEGCTSLESIKISDNIKQASSDLFEKYKFIDLETGNEITSALPDPNSTAGSEEESTGGGSGTTTPTVPTQEFKPEGATAYGHLTGEYNKRIIIDTYWAYYDDTKTLEFTSLTTNYNETGALSNCDDTNWSDYKDVIEHIIVGDNIAKVSGKSFIGYPSLKDVRLGAQVAQIDDDAFKDCTNLTTIWRNGKERIEGRADFRGFSRFCDALVGTSVSEIVLPEKLSTLELNMPMSLKTAYFTTLTEELKAHAAENLYDLVNINDPNEKYENYVYIDPALPLCGGRAVFGFDEATGTLTVYGAGAIDDIINYHGGGSKTQPWFSIKKQIKHIIITEKITAIGKYAFAECKNLETVQIPNTDGFLIAAAAFEGCENMKSVYLCGNEPIEGTVDVRNVHTLESWTFAYNYLIANAVISPKVEKIGNSVFSDNTNLANIYGTPGSFAEEYAANNEFTFYDIASEMPKAIKCEPPVTTTEAVNSESSIPETTSAPESTAETVKETETDVNGVKFIKIDDRNAAPIKEKNDINALPIIIAISSAAVVLIAVIVIIALKKKTKK